MAETKQAYIEKQVVIDEIKDKFERAESAVVIDYMGITVEEADAMRKKLRETSCSNRTCYIYVSVVYSS